VDHVRPFAHGGYEAEDNLVPACERCNKTKNSKLLIHWDAVRVAHGAAHSQVVAAELERELAFQHAQQPLGMVSEGPVSDGGPGAMSSLGPEIITS